MHFEANAGGRFEIVGMAQVVHLLYRLGDQVPSALHNHTEAIQEVPAKVLYLTLRWDRRQRLGRSGQLPPRRISDVVDVYYARDPLTGTFWRVDVTDPVEYFRTFEDVPEFDEYGRRGLYVCYRTGPLRGETRCETVTADDTIIDFDNHYSILVHEGRGILDVPRDIFEWLHGGTTSLFMDLW